MNRGQLLLLFARSKVPAHLPTVVDLTVMRLEEMAPISILLITGSFVTPDAYASIVDRVIGQAIEIRALHLPTVGASPRQGRDGRPPTMYDDAALIAQEVDRLADQGKHVILIAHSYGGVPTSQSIQGRSISDRQRKGQRGGIVRVGYMTALVPEIGHSALDVLADVPPEGQTHMETDVCVIHDLKTPTLYPSQTLKVVVTYTSRKTAGCCIRIRLRPQRSL